MDDDAGQPLGSANPLQLVVERQDEQIKQLKSQQKKKNKDDELKTLRDDVRKLGESRERYRVASLFLGFIFLISVAVIFNRQWELDSAIDRSRYCTGRVVDLEKKVGECGQLQEQLTELKNCRNEVKNLTEVKGKCIVYEENLKDQNSKALVKQGDDLLVLLSKRDDFAAKEAEKNDECQKHLRKVEIEARQLVTNVSALVIEKEKCTTNRKVCLDQLTECRGSSINPSETS